MDFAGLTKKDLTEEDIKLKYITPALQKAEWDIIFRFIDNMA